jgi:uncharacterized protein (TIGR02147 family)
MGNDKLSIFDYAEFRRFLSEYYAHAKSKDRKFSQRYIARQVGASSGGWFADIVQGRISLTGTYMVRLAKLLGLDAEERDYFELLVSYDQAGSLEEKNIYLGKIMSCKRINPAIVSREQFEFYSNWYISAIRELLFTYDFKDDYKALAKELNPPITAQQAKHAVKVLQKLGFVEPDGKLYLRPCDTIIKKDSTFKSVYWANFMKANMELAVEALDRYGKDDRDISAVTMSFSQEAYPQACEEIKKLRRKLLVLAQNDKARGAVYQCNVQLFPLTKKKNSASG